MIEANKSIYSAKRIQILSCRIWSFKGIYHWKKHILLLELTATALLYPSHSAALSWLQATKTHFSDHSYDALPFFFCLQLFILVSTLSHSLMK